jgi:hypothetical protein
LLDGPAPIGDASGTAETGLVEAPGVRHGHTISRSGAGHQGPSATASCSAASQRIPKSARLDGQAPACLISLLEQAATFLQLSTRTPILSLGDQSIAMAV